MARIFNSPSFEYIMRTHCNMQQTIFRMYLPLVGIIIRSSLEYSTYLIGIFMFVMRIFNRAYQNIHVAHRNTQQTLVRIVVLHIGIFNRTWLEYTCHPSEYSTISHWNIPVFIRTLSLCLLEYSCFHHIRNLSRSLLGYSCNSSVYSAYLNCTLSSIWSSQKTWLRMAAKFPNLIIYHNHKQCLINIRLKNQLLWICAISYGHKAEERRVG